MPSLSEVSKTEFLFVTKSEADHDLIVALLIDKTNYREKMQYKIGNQEGQYPTDCVTAVCKPAFYIALNKRTKSSEVYKSEISMFDIESGKKVGFFERDRVCCRMITSMQKQERVVLFMLTHVLVLDSTLQHLLAKISYKDSSLGMSILQSGYRLDLNN